MYLTQPVKMKLISKEQRMYKMSATLTHVACTPSVQLTDRQHLIEDLVCCKVARKATLACCTERAAHGAANLAGRTTSSQAL
jgi:hypothetical protein